jgi:hypothetical protein
VKSASSRNSRRTIALAQKSRAINQFMIALRSRSTPAASTRLRPRASESHSPSKSVSPKHLLSSFDVKADHASLCSVAVSP